MQKTGKEPSISRRKASEEQLLLHKMGVTWAFFTRCYCFFHSWCISERV